MSANVDPVGEPLHGREVVKRPRLVEVNRDAALDPHVIERNLARRMVIGRGRLDPFT